MLLNLESGCQGLNKNSLIITYTIRHEMETFLRDGDLISKSTVMLLDAHDRSMSTVIPKPSLTSRTIATITVDFPDNASPRKWSRRSHSNEFMTKNTSKAHVPLRELQVSFANTGYDHIDKHLSGARNG